MCVELSIVLRGKKRKMLFYVYVFLGILLRSQVFEVNNGNDDWMDLVHPEKYGLTQTQNFYMKVCTNEVESVNNLTCCIVKMSFSRLKRLISPCLVDSMMVPRKTKLELGLLGRKL